MKREATTPETREDKAKHDVVLMKMGNEYHAWVINGDSLEPATIHWMEVVKR